VRLLGDYLAGKRQELQTWNEALGPVAELAANRRKLTNIGTFRAFALAYLRNHPNVHQGMTCMVRQMQTTAEGVPLEIYSSPPPRCGRSTSGFKGISSITCWRCCRSLA